MVSPFAPPFAVQFAYLAVVVATVVSLVSSHVRKLKVVPIWLVFVMLSLATVVTAVGLRRITQYAIPLVSIYEDFLRRKTRRTQFF